MTKIVHVSAIYVDTHSYQEQILPRIQVSMGYDVTMITPINISVPYYTMTKDDYAKTKPYYHQGVRIVRIGQKHGFLGWRFASMKNLCEQIEAEKPDVLFCHNVNGLDVLAVCKYKREHPECCCIADSHSDRHNSGSTVLSRTLLHKGLWRWVARRAEKQLDRIYYISPNCGDFLKEMYGLSAEKLGATYLGADMSLIDGLDRTRVRIAVRRELGLGDGEFLIVTAGKLDGEKRTHLLLEAVEKLNDPSVHVAVVGSVEKGYERKLLDYATRNPNIHFTGWVSSEEVLQYFVAGDLGIFPHRQSVLWQQAICCGLPCIFGYYPGGDYLNPGGNAKFLYSEEPDELVQLIELLIGNPSELEKMRVGALSRGVERFDYRNIAEEIVRFAETVRR